MVNHQFIPPIPQQNLSELSQFIDILKAEGVRSYLEIGSKTGGTLWAIANALPKGSLIVSVDLPWGNKSTQPVLEGCVTELDKIGYRTNLFLADSTDRFTVRNVQALGPYDACFIDANHTLPYVTKDWENYGPMCKIVAFHDIAWRDKPGREGRMPINAPEFWNSIKDNYRHQEIKLEKRDNGIGVLWR